ncbi:MAG: hypothetical protein MK074_02675 [Phycisphaerales bacterium]|nr:hypothetical protein [Phycisphaerales bacterium]
MPTLTALTCACLICGPIPDDVRDQFLLAPHYDQVEMVGPLPVLASDRTHPVALMEATWLIEQMIGHRPEILAAMADRRCRFVIMAHDEFTTDVPEHRDLYPRTWWDVRARGLGATDTRPAVSCGEENLLAMQGDPYATENILIHEFAHAIHQMGLVDVDPSFDGRLKTAWRRALDKGLWDGTYAATNHFEYWAEGVQSWFDTNRQNDAQHNAVDTRVELVAYDPDLAALCKEVFGDSEWRYINPRRRLPSTAGTEHLTEFDRAAAGTFTWPIERRVAYDAENARRKATARQPDEDVIAWLERRTAAGCFDAMVDLGRRYRDGDGVTQSHELAAITYAPAAEAGYPPALDHLGWLCWASETDVHDMQRATQLLSHAADGGHVQSMLHMAVLQPERSEYWWRRAACHGHPVAVNAVRRLQEDTSDQ